MSEPTSAAEQGAPRRGLWRRAARYAPGTYDVIGTWHFWPNTGNPNQPFICGKALFYARSWRDQREDNPPADERCKKCVKSLAEPALLPGSTGEVS